MFTSAQPALFTTEPLDRRSSNDQTYPTQLTASPTQYYARERQSREARFDKLSFSKIPLQCSTTTSTDSETNDGSVDVSRDPTSRSPSLLTSLFLSQSRQASYTSCSPVTPVEPTVRCGKPILRHHAPSASASTSASEDGPHITGLGLALAILPDSAKTDSKILVKEQSCLKFDVRCIPRAASQSPTSYSTKSPSSYYHGLPALDVVESESDEGYQEDEEGGFTSDEKEMDTSSPGPSNWKTWPRRQDRASPAIARSPDSLRPTSAIDRPLRGRQVNISAPRSAGRNDRCSRHCSPPPQTISLDPAPPAARSPSAADLCRRRKSTADRSRHYWRSDDSAFPENAPQSPIFRKASLPEPKCRSILLSSPITVCQNQASVSPTCPTPRESLSAISPSIGVDNLSVMACTMSVSCGQDARHGLEKALRECSTENSCA